jgi:hypothetical protein
MVTVASLLQNMDYVGSLDSSRDLQSIHAKNFVNRLHLVLQIGKIPSKILRLRLFCVYGVGAVNAKTCKLLHPHFAFTSFCVYGELNRPLIKQSHHQKFLFFRHRILQPPIIFK